MKRNRIGKEIYVAYVFPETKEKIKKIAKQEGKFQVQIIKEAIDLYEKWLEKKKTDIEIE